MGLLHDLYEWAIRVHERRRAEQIAQWTTTAMMPATYRWTMSFTSNAPDPLAFNRAKQGQE